MRILKFKLIAFGPFTDVTIDLDKGDGDFHLIYGPNEAGKSSALRALTQVLFGIPTRSPDNFIHPHQQMRIGCVLQHSDGTVIEFVRRKGRKNTLRTPDDAALLDETILHKFLGGLTREIFATMFGIGHEDLVRGGQEIIRGSGNIGRALFAAGAGISDLGRVQAELAQEAEALFTPSATKKTINIALRKLREIQSQIRQAELPGSEWKKHDTALKEAISRKKEIEAALEEKTSEKKRLWRIKEALPLIARRKELLKELGNYRDVVILPEDFAERRTESLKEYRILLESKSQAQEELQRIDEEIEGIDLDENILNHADLIEDLYQQLGSYKKASKDRVKLSLQAENIRREAEEILHRLNDSLALEDAHELKLKKTEMARIRELSTSLEKSRASRTEILEQISKLELILKRIEADLGITGSPKKVDDLLDAVELAREHAPMEKHHVSKLLEVENSVKSLKARLSQQSLWAGSIEDLLTLSIPSSETIDRFEETLGEAEAEIKSLCSEIRKTEEELLNIKGSIESLRLEQEVPTEEDLISARELRDSGWMLVKKAWEEGLVDEQEAKDFTGLFNSDDSLAGAYEKSVEQADEIADRLRREADRVATKAKLLGDKEVKTRKLDHLKKELQKITEKHAKITNDWLKAWEPVGIIPLSPREMRAWRQEMVSIAEELTKLEKLKKEAETGLKEVEDHKNTLARHLVSLGIATTFAGKSLPQLIKIANRFVKEQEKIENKREKLLSDKKARELELQEANARLNRLDQEISNLETEWEKALKPLGLSRETSPVEANAFLEDLTYLFDKLKEEKKIEKRIEGIDRDARQFESDLLELAGHVSAELIHLPPEHLAAELNARLKTARTAETRLANLRKQRRDLDKKLKKAEEKLRDLMVLLDEMCKEAGCSSYEELHEAEKKSLRKRKLRDELEIIEEEIRKLAAGVTVEEFVVEAEEEEADTLDVRIERYKQEVETLEKERSELDQAIGREKTILEGMTGESTAAELAEERQAIIGRLETDIYRYIRLRIASAILARTIEAYREKHQGPIMKRTNELFSQLTLGSFQGIRAEYDDRGEPVLVGVRAGGNQIVTVEGMSDGTVDQLYLALRLASLDMYLKSNEPVPFVVDDILIRFDNERSVAALKVLKDLSKKTQVIFFTHHSHLVKLAEENLGSGIIKHSLERFSS